jgi:hypothetical protein
MTWYTCIAKEGVKMLLSKVLEKKQDRQHENEMQLLMLFVCKRRRGEAKKEETETNTRETSKEVTSLVERLIDFHWRMFLGING